jgi:SAM-dependent methyltransferase
LGFRARRVSAAELATLYRDMEDSAYNAESQGRMRTATRLLSIVRQHVNGGRLLDVGCSSGLFLVKAAEAGFDVVGLDPARAATGQARAALGDRGQVLEGTLEDVDLPAGSFDAVTMWDVLEHVAEPTLFLRRASSLLREGGHLFVNVPDLESWPARLLGRRWPLLLPEHLNYFTEKSLSACAERAGLGPVASGSRPVSFSIAYILQRLGEHGVPGTSLARRATRSLGIESSMLSVSIGERYEVWRRVG